jgi:hypothetical protein
VGGALSSSTAGVLLLRGDKQVLCLTAEAKYQWLANKVNYTYHRLSFRVVNYRHCMA